MSLLSSPSTRPRPHPDGLQAWSVDPKETPGQGTTERQASIIHQITESSCGPLLGASSWNPSLLATDPKSQELFVAELGKPRVKVFDRHGKYLREFASSGGVECLCVVPGEAVVVIATDEIKVSKMLGLKKEEHRKVSATVKPFLDFKPDFEFSVKSRFVLDKKAPPARYSMAFDPVGSRFLFSDSTCSFIRAFSSTSGNLLWEKPKTTTKTTKKGGSDTTSPVLLRPLGITVDDKQNMFVCDVDARQPAVKALDKEARLMYLLGEGRGTGDRNLINPSSIVNHGNLLLIGDRVRNCISAYAADSGGVASMSWQFTLLIHGEPLSRQACAPTLSADGPSSLALADDGCLWVAYPTIATVFKAKWL